MSSGVPQLEVPVGVSLAPVDARRLSGVRAKAFSLQTLEAVAAERFGGQVIAEWRAGVGFDFAGVTPASWVPLELYYHLVELLVRRHLDRDERRAAELGTEVARREINGFFRLVLGFTSPLVALSMSSRFWRSYFDRSEFVVVESGPGYLRAEVRDWPLTNAAVGYELGGALLAWLQASRASAPVLQRLAWLRPGVLFLDATW